MVVPTCETFAVSPNVSPKCLRFAMLLTFDKKQRVRHLIETVLVQNSVKRKPEHLFKGPFWHHRYNMIVISLTAECQVTYMHLLIICHMSSDLTAETSYFNSFPLNFALRIQRIVTDSCSQDVASTGHLTFPVNHPYNSAKTFGDVLLRAFCWPTRSWRFTGHRDDPTWH